MKVILLSLWGSLFLFCISVHASEEISFPLLLDSGTVRIVIDKQQELPILRAAGDLQSDILKVVGQEPGIGSKITEDDSLVIVIGQLNAGGLIDEWVTQGRLDASDIRGKWESFAIEELKLPGDSEQRVLVVAGSDMRGTIYGIYQISRDIGVSPWWWWADVAIAHDPDASIPSERRVWHEPSIKYRGIFINDEDWGLHPWAAKTFDPELGDIGPKTYARVFELLLRLRANCLWPAMHHVSRPFNEDASNAKLAHEYGIIMGSSHAEPMLRNNVREWTDAPEKYNYLTNREGVFNYWKTRVEENAGYENIYTVGMRGIHDSGMRGGLSEKDQIGLLETIISDQRSLLKTYVDTSVDEIPQIFVAYKEVLELYRGGLEVPADVTVVWPDDNFGYIRDFATDEEIKGRKGGFGVYYHISYLGRPMAYLWLETTPPALIWEEMTKAYAHGANRFWILNVGDIKPAEIGTDFFFRLAWDVDGFSPDRLPGYLPHWAEETFGEEYADDVAAIMEQYYLLNFRRKPEHLQYNLPLQPYEPSGLSDREIDERLDAFHEIVRESEALFSDMPAALQDSYFELVHYPVLGSSAANDRYFWTERYRRDPSREAAVKANEADQQLQKLTEQYNLNIANGKWNHLMNLEPADDDWRSMRIAELELPSIDQGEADLPELHQHQPEDRQVVWTSAAADFQSVESSSGNNWTEIPGLGRSGRAMTVIPFAGPEPDEGDSPVLTTELKVDREGTYLLKIELLPTFPIGSYKALCLGLSVNRDDMEKLTVERRAGEESWKHEVLDARVVLEKKVQLIKGANVLSLYGIQRGVVVDRIEIEDLPLN